MNKALNLVKIKKMDEIKQKREIKLIIIKNHLIN